MDDVEYESLPVCNRCQQPIKAAEPYASLVMSQRFFDDDEERSISVPAEFLIATLCRNCGEQYQLTSPHVLAETKLCRFALLVSEIQRALHALPPLPEFPHPARQQTDYPEPWGLCTFCGESLQLEEPWMDLSMSYERYTVNPDTLEPTIETIDLYDSVSMCIDCCLQMPFPILEADDNYSAVYDWTAAFVRLLGAVPDHR